MSYETTTERGFLLSTREWGVIGGATGLMLLNVFVMYLAAATPLARVNQIVFSVPIVGALVYGALITGGQMIAERGFKNDSMGMAMAGVIVLELAFGAFGGGVLSFLSAGARIPALAIAGVVVVAMTAVIGSYVYLRSGTQFDHYGRWATYAFLGGLGALLVATFVPVVGVAAFALIFLGFLLRLGYEMWQVRESRGRPAMQSVGLYVAVAGVFVHVLQIVVRMLAER
ncbi:MULTISPECIES: hypothetical protein [Halolamina]|uniref:Bax inhibitor-1/YccA family protein n=1 Tax=Halolamina pelagica TaxID=699431 RepID=A0A1I5RQ11_9EURY|nr:MULTISPECIES: hypothetical protein [Halolamina]NHX35285.1 hypothetical protein [Halolamina sp. R1-12]SFP60487.1 hypothetical protein SAMN05216277_10580 [Halolamina pelagica]